MMGIPMKLIGHANQPLQQIDPRWLTRHSEWGSDDLGLWVRPFADDASILRIDFFDCYQSVVLFDGLCRLTSRDRTGYLCLNAFTPAMRLFDVDGNLEHDCLQTQELQAFLISFAARVPGPLRRFIGRFTSPMEQWAVLDIFQAHLDLGEMLEDHEAYLFEALRLGLLVVSKSQFGTLVRLIQRGKRTETMGKLLGFRVQPRHVRALCRFEEEVTSDSRDEFWKICRSDLRFRALSHADRIDNRLIQGVAGVPTWIDDISPKIFRLLDGEAAEHLASLVEYDQMASIPRKVLAQVKSASSKQAVMAISCVTQFPPCPVSGDKFLEPIADLKALQRAGRKLRNCAADLGGEVLDGDSYFLLWKGSRPGLVEIVRDGREAWRFRQAQGCNNEQLGPGTIKAIKRRLKIMGI